MLCCVCGVLGQLALLHWCERSVDCLVCAVSLASSLPLMGVPSRCVVRSVCLATWLLFTVCPLGPLCSVCGVLGHLARVRWCACPLCCAFGVLGHLAPIHGCARSMSCVACAVSLASWLSLTSVQAWCIVFPVRCLWPPGSPSPVPMLRVLCSVCGVLGHFARVRWCACPFCRAFGVLGNFAPVHRCARSMSCVACALSLARWLQFAGVPAWCVVFRVRCPWSPGSPSPVSMLRVLCCVCGVLGHLALVHCR